MSINITIYYVIINVVFKEIKYSAYTKQKRRKIFSYSITFSTNNNLNFYNVSSIDDRNSLCKLVLVTDHSKIQ